MAIRIAVGVPGWQPYQAGSNFYIDGLTEDCSNSSALVMEFLQSCTKLSIYNYVIRAIRLLPSNKTN